MANREDQQQRAADQQRAEQETQQRAQSPRTTDGEAQRMTGDPRLPEGPSAGGTVTRNTVGTPQPHGGVRAGAPTDVQRAVKEQRGDPTATGEKKPRPPYAVATGKSITSPRGILDAGSEVRLEDVGGADNMERLVQKGVIVKS